MGHMIKNIILKIKIEINIYTDFPQNVLIQIKVARFNSTSF